MANVSFSLTEELIVHPNLTLQVPPLPDPKKPPCVGALLWHVVEGQLAARIVGLFTSITAAADAPNTNSVRLRSADFCPIVKKTGSGSKRITEW